MWNDIFPWILPNPKLHKGLRFPEYSHMPGWGSLDILKACGALDPSSNRGQRIYYIAGKAGRDKTKQLR